MDKSTIDSSAVTSSSTTSTKRPIVISWYESPSQVVFKRRSKSDVVKDNRGDEADLLSYEGEDETTNSLDSLDAMQMSHRRRHRRSRPSLSSFRAKMNSTIQEENTDGSQNDSAPSTPDGSTSLDDTIQLGRRTCELLRARAQVPEESLEADEVDVSTPCRKRRHSDSQVGSQSSDDGSILLTPSHSRISIKKSRVAGNSTSNHSLSPLVGVQSLNVSTPSSSSTPRCRIEQRSMNNSMRRVEFEDTKTEDLKSQKENMVAVKSQRIERGRAKYGQKEGYASDDSFYETDDEGEIDNVPKTKN